MTLLCFIVFWTTKILVKTRKLAQINKKCSNIHWIIFPAPKTRINWASRWIFEQWTHWIYSTPTNSCILKTIEVHNWVSVTNTPRSLILTVNTLPVYHRCDGFFFSIQLFQKMTGRHIKAKKKLVLSAFDWFK